MRVLNNVSDADDPVLYEVRGSLYDRFYEPPTGSYADQPQFDWIGRGHDWSGVGRGDGSAIWATTVSPSWFLVATHASGGGDRTFRHGNSIDSTFEVHSRRGGRSLGNRGSLGSDLFLGRLLTAVSDQIAVYPVYTSENAEDLVGLEIYIFGRTDFKPEFGGDQTLQVRLGRNVIESVRALANTNGSDLQENGGFTFSFDVSVSDFTGPNLKGDGFVDELDESLILQNVDLQEDFPGGPMFSYVDGDIDRSPGSVGLIDFLTDGAEFFFDLGLLSVDDGATGGLGWDEALTQGGDSGGPSFTLVEFKLGGTMPAIIGAHSRVGTDAYAGHDPAEMIAQFELERPMIAGRATEVLCFTSFSRKFVLGADGYDLPPGLQENKRVFGDVNGDYRLTTDDILTLEQEIVNHRDHGPYPYNWGFDLDADGNIDADDMATLMEQGFKTSRADIARVTGGVVAEPDGIVDVLADAFVQVGNLGMVNPSFLDGDLNLDGQVNVLGDAFILVGELGTFGMLRLQPDFNDDGVLNAEDIDLLTPALHPTDPAPYDPMFDLTTSMLAADGVTEVPNPDAAAVPDGVVDLADLVFYFEEVLGTAFGDLNFDGTLDTLGDRFQQAVSFGSQGGFAAGDLDFDGEVTCFDAAILKGLVIGEPPDFSNCQ
jgi:hypothetical protein